MFNPIEESNEFEPELDEYGQEIEDRDGSPLSKGSIVDDAFEKEKQYNIDKTAKMQGRRAKMAPYIEKFKSTLMAMFHQKPRPSDLYTALELVYDMVLQRLERSLNGSEEEARQWLRIAMDLINIDEYSLMESVDGMLHVTEHSAIRSALEKQYENILRTARGDYAKEAQLFIEIAFALVTIVEEQIEIQPNDADDYIELKEMLDGKYGPIYHGISNQMRDMMGTDRRYGRSIAR